MLDEALTTLAMTGATTIVAAMATQAWQATRTGVLQLFHHDQTQQTTITAQLDGDAVLVTEDDDADGARRALVSSWKLRLEKLLRQHPDAADELRALMAEVQAELPQSQQRWVQNNTSHDHGTVFAVQGGNLHLHKGPGDPDAGFERGSHRTTDR
ncbi:hypothetical protein OHT76_00360 [Streptomyces sp. NBC_00287]|uniref:hypothetical protein n=1 Tax=Streptomyces sp. NBC_00287 TaxID=2975702 RepID=UPI002E2CE36F|nr:hypothetical protein [Streptomyces sp. NBC_00287]